MLNDQNTCYTLLRRALDTDDQEAWSQLTEHYRRFIYFVLHRLNVFPDDLDDISQQVLMRLLKDLPKYDRKKSKFRSWLSAVIRNTAVDYIRHQASRKRRIEGLRAETECQLLCQPAEVDALIQREWATYITNEALARVRKIFQGQAVDVFLKGMDGQSAQEIADDTGLSVASVYTLRARVKKRLYLEVLELTADLEG